MKTSNKKFRTWHLVLERADWLELPWSGTLALSFWYRSPSLPALPLFLHFLQLLFPVPHDCSNVSKTILQIGQLPCIVCSCIFSTPPPHTPPPPLTPRTPLHYAAASRHFHCLETLVACGTTINATDQWERSPLHYAAASDLDRR